MEKIKDNLSYEFKRTTLDMSISISELNTKLNVSSKDLTNDYLIDNNVYNLVEHLEDEIKKIKLLTSLLK